MADETPMTRDPSTPTAHDKPSASTNVPILEKLGVYVVGAVVVVALSQMIPFRALMSLHPATHRAVADDCRECGGDGKAERSCRLCFGRGYIHGANYAECDKTGKVEETCRYCGGSGKKPKN